MKPELNKFDTPTGFIPVIKSTISAIHDDNICRYCDARPLCQANENEWCKNNPCMSYSRVDGVGVVFKKE